MRTRNPGWMLLPAFVLSHSLSAGAQGPATTWPATTPRAVGLDPQVLAKLGADIAAGTYGYIDTLLIIRHGQVAYERAYRHAYDEIYGEQARTAGPLNAHDPAGPYNHFN